MRNLLALVTAVALLGAACVDSVGGTTTTTTVAVTTTTTTQQEEACSATGLAADATGGEGLPQAVADVRLAIIEAALACDYDGLAELARAGGPTFTYAFSETSDTSAQTPPNVWDAAAYWREEEAFGLSTLASLVQILGLPYSQIETQFEAGVFVPIYEWPADADSGGPLGITDDGDWVYFVGGGAP